MEDQDVKKRNSLPVPRDPPLGCLPLRDGSDSTSIAESDVVWFLKSKLPAMLKPILSNASNNFTNTRLMSVYFTAHNTCSLNVNKFKISHEATHVLVYSNPCVLTVLVYSNPCVSISVVHCAPLLSTFLDLAISPEFIHLWKSEVKIWIYNV